MIQVKQNSILVWRVGPVSTRKQTHWNKGHHQPPCKRGLWAFPYTKHDRFFIYPTQIESRLPKEYQTDYTQDHSEEWWNEREHLIRIIIKRIGQSVWWHQGGFWSHVFPNGNTDYAKWFWWDSPKDWFEVIGTEIYAFERANGKVFKLNYAVDHLELFLEKP